MNNISITSIIDEWVEDKPLEQENISYSQLLRWGHDVAREVSTIETKKHNIVVLPLTNTKAELPPDFYSIISVGYRKVKKSDNCITVNKVVEYTQNLHNGCEYKIRVNCDKCKNLECNCDTKQEVIEVDVDKIFEMENPWYYNVSKFGFPGNSEELNAYSLNDNNFKLMSYATGNFHNIKHHIPHCVNLDCTYCEHKYKLSLPFIETDILTRQGDKVEILLAYLGTSVDEKGNMLVPDMVNVIEAVHHHLDYKWYKMMAEKSIGTSAANDYKFFYKDAEQSRDRSIGRVKSETGIPTPDQLYAQMYELFKPKKLVY